MPAADDRSWNGIYRRSGPAAKPRGREIDFQLFTSGHPPGALMRAAAAARQSLRPAERPCAWRSSRRCSKCKITYTCCNAKRRPPGCPLKCGSGRGGLLWAGCGVSSVPRSLLAGSKPCRAPSPHNRSHPWRFWRAINRASTMKHPALVGISGFMVVRYCKHRRRNRIAE